MKLYVFTLAASSLFGLGFFTKKNPVPEFKTEPVIAPNTYKSFAVLELFTSEGCSSCPSADNLLPQLAKLDPNVIVLSFHVDYWNRLGWTDPFSSAEFSERQREYGKQFKLESIYTPQLVVNGEYQLVGSNRNTATQTIKNALKENATIQVKINEVRKEASAISISCEATGDLKKNNLFAALVQKQAIINVKAGENNGSRLSHTNVVRSFIKKSLEQKLNFELPVPKDINDNNWELILFTQQKNDLKITGVALYN